MDELRVFRNPRNRLCAFFDNYGFIPVASTGDDIPVFVSAPPRKVGDEAIIHVEGRRRKVELLRSSGGYKSARFLVDLGVA